MGYKQDSNEYLNYETYLYADETFVAIRYRGVYVWIPLKIVSSHSHENKTMVVYGKIWDEIYAKAKSDVARNNFCELYF